MSPWHRVGMVALMLGLNASVCWAISGEITRPTPRLSEHDVDTKDLDVIRDLDSKVRRGEISEEERTLLWQAYLARLSSSPARRDTTSPAPHRKPVFPIFTGPGL